MTNKVVPLDVFTFSLTKLENKDARKSTFPLGKLENKDVIKNTYLPHEYLKLRTNADTWTSCLLPLPPLPLYGSA